MDKAADGSSGIASASEIAYESYMFLIVDQKYYKLVASYTRAATLVGRFFAYALAQILVSFNYGSFLLLNQISFGATCIVIPIAAAFPPITSEIIKAQGKKVDAIIVRDEKIDVEPRASDVSTSSRTGNTVKRSGELRNQNSEEERTALKEKSAPNIEHGIATYFRAIWHQFKIFKRNEIVLKWCIWWALSSCGIYQVINYVQTLWARMQTLSDTFNGLTECANTFFCALISFLTQYINVNWIIHGELILFGTSASIALWLAIMSQSKSLAVSYILYVGVISVYSLLITAASANIATQLDSASYGLVFGFNTFLALLLETILTLAVADKHGFALSIQKQFVVYSCYFAVIALIFFIIIIWKCIVRLPWESHDDNTAQSTTAQHDGTTEFLHNEIDTTSAL